MRLSARSIRIALTVGHDMPTARAKANNPSDRRPVINFSTYGLGRSAMMASVDVTSANAPDGKLPQFIIVELIYVGRVPRSGATDDLPTRQSFRFNTAGYLLDDFVNFAGQFRVNGRKFLTDR